MEPSPKEQIEKWAEQNNLEAYDPAGPAIYRDQRSRGRCGRGDQPGDVMSRQKTLPMNIQPIYISKTETAKLLGVSMPTVRRLELCGKLTRHSPPVGVGIGAKRVFFDRGEVEQLVAELQKFQAGSKTE